jgi:hypothetical protein
VGGGEKTGGIFPQTGELGIFELMPKGIRGSPFHRAPCDKFQVFLSSVKGKTVIFPSKQLKFRAT